MRSTTIFKDKKTTWAPYKGKNRFRKFLVFEKFQIITVAFKKWQIHWYFLQSWASILWFAWTRHFVKMLRGRKKNNVRCRSGICRGKWHCLLSPALPVSCLISYPDSFSCLQSPTPVSSLIFCLLLSHVYCLQSSLFCFMSSVAYFILLSPISYFIRAGLTCPRCVFRARVTSLTPASRLSWPHHVFRIFCSSKCILLTQWGKTQQSSKSIVGHRYF